MSEGNRNRGGRAAESKGEPRRFCGRDNKKSKNANAAFGLGDSDEQRSVVKRKIIDQ